jgi:hypothetical protein
VTAAANNFLDQVMARMVGKQPLVPAPAQPDPSGWLRLEDAAAYAGVTARTLRNWEAAGLAVYRPTRRSAMVRKSDIDAFIMGRASGTVSNEKAG